MMLCFVAGLISVGTMVHAGSADPMETMVHAGSADSLETMVHAGSAERARTVAHTGPASRMVSISATSTQIVIPQHLYMPPNPDAPPGQELARSTGLASLLAERTTNYYHASASQGRNIELVAKRMNGVLVQPGETFSYHDHVGPYTQANGYGWGRAFDGNRIVPSMGGGVCQGASTLYSALLRTDLKIVERHNHGLTVPYLPAGEDATVAASAHMDFRFTNTEKTPILITASANPAKRFLTVAIWGAHSGPQIEVRHRVLAEYPYQTVQCNEHKGHAAGQVGVHAAGQVGVQAAGQAGVHAAGQAGVRAAGQVGEQAGGQTGGQAGGQAGVQAAGQVGVQAGRPVERVVFPGQEGALVETWVDVHDSNGVSHRLVSKDAYQASNRIITGK